MCGIAGFYDAKEALPDGNALLSRMIGAIRHRGPDDSGIMIDRPAGLAHARLSIIDIEGGRQPMSNGEGTVHISFNGEVFNYVELRADLVARGCRFTTQSDTEVILRLYETFGVDCIEMLNGDFAFAIWDARQRRLVLARDRIGVRPLFYALHRGSLVFASEIGALLRVPGLRAELDPIALDQIFTLWFPIGERTAFRDVLELPPAHYLIADRNGIAVRRYWQLRYPDRDDHRAPGRHDEEQAGEELRELLADATRIRLRADVPVGSYLSGGLDSSIVTSLASELAPGRLRTFSVTFDSAEFDESGYQRQMIDMLASEHTSVACSSPAIGHLFPDVIRHAERPILRTAPAPLMALSGLVRESGFKVVLTGEGADELFAGYDIFKEAQVRRFCARQPDSRWRWSLLRRLYPYLPRLQNQQEGYLKAFFGADLDVGDPLFSHLPRFRSTMGAKMFFSGELAGTLNGYDALQELRESLPAEFARWHPLSQAQYLETTFLLPNYILSSQGDRMAMANGVEGRFPFLDPRLVDFAAGLAPRLKLRTLREKHILRDTMRSRVPAQIVDRPKQPYRAPEASAFLGPGAPDYVADLLDPSTLESTGYFDPRLVRRLVSKASARPNLGFRDNAALVGIVATQLWDREFRGVSMPQQNQLALT